LLRERFARTEDGIIAGFVHTPVLHGADSSATGANEPTRAERVAHRERMV